MTVVKGVRWEGDGGALHPSTSANPVRRVVQETVIHLTAHRYVVQTYSIDCGVQGTSLSLSIATCTKKALILIGQYQVTNSHRNFRASIHDRCFPLAVYSTMLPIVWYSNSNQLWRLDFLPVLIAE